MRFKKKRGDYKNIENQIQTIFRKEVLIKKAIPQDISRWNLYSATDKNCNEELQNSLSENSKGKMETRNRRISANLKVAIIVGLIITLLSGMFAVNSRRLGLFKMFDGSHNINFSTREIQVTEHDPKEIKSYSSIDNLLKDIKISLPVMTEFPEKMTEETKYSVSAGEVEEIRVQYLSLDEAKFFKVKYEYTDHYNYAYSANYTFDDEENLSIWGNDITLYSDMERCIAIWNYDDFVITIETNYNKEMLKQIINKTEIRRAE